MRNVKVYSTSVCPFCNNAKQILKEKGIEFEDINLDSDPDLRMKLSQENKGWRTVPMIFIGDEFIGGFDDLVKLNASGQLDSKVSGG